MMLAASTWVVMNACFTTITFIILTQIGRVDENRRFEYESHPLETKAAGAWLLYRCNVYGLAVPTLTVIDKVGLSFSLAGL